MYRKREKLYDLSAFLFLLRYSRWHYILTCNLLIRSSTQFNSPLFIKHLLYSGFCLSGLYRTPESDSNTDEDKLTFVILLSLLVGWMDCFWKTMPPYLTLEAFPPPFRSLPAWCEAVMWTLGCSGINITWIIRLLTQKAFGVNSIQTETCVRRAPLLCY